jgi:hypothetical protein
MARLGAHPALASQAEQIESYVCPRCDTRPAAVRRPCAPASAGALGHLGAAAEALAAAAAEGLELKRSERNATGFSRVYRQGRRFEAQISDGSRCRSLGAFGTAEAAALAVARARADAPVRVEMSAAEALAAAAAEGLELQRSSVSASGFKGVTQDTRLKASRKTFVVQHGGARMASLGGVRVVEGCFATAEEAALALARARASQAPCTLAARGDDDAAAQPPRVLLKLSAPPLPPPAHTHTPAAPLPATAAAGDSDDSDEEGRRLAFQMREHRELAARPPPALAPAASSDTWRMGARTRGTF